MKALEYDYVELTDGRRGTVIYSCPEYVDIEINCKIIYAVPFSDIAKVLNRPSN